MTSTEPLASPSFEPLGPEMGAQMTAQDIIGVGASAGGVDALRTLVSGLPADLAAAVFIVLHIGNGTNGHSYLPDILAKACALEVVRPFDGDRIERGKSQRPKRSMRITVSRRSTSFSFFIPPARTMNASLSPSPMASNEVRGRPRNLAKSVIL